MILSSISYHFPIFISIETENNISSQEPQEIQYIIIDNNCILQFKADLRNSIINLYTNPSITSANDAFTIFFNIFNELYNKNFPIVTKITSKKSLLKPWVTESLVKRIKIRERLGRLARRG